MAVYTSTSPIFWAALIAAGFFVMATPITHFFVYKFFNGWSFSNFSWWIVEFSIAIYILLIVLPDENLQKIFLWVSHYIQGVTVALLLLNIGLFMDTILIWMEEIDLSNVFKTDIELIARNMANFELFQTLPTIGYLFMVYFFLVDIRQFYTKQDGTITELIFSVYTNIANAKLTEWIAITNNFFVSGYVLMWQAIVITVLPLVYFNQFVQWWGEITLKAVKWCIGIFQSVFLWWYGILVIIFNWFVPIF